MNIIKKFFKYCQTCYDELAHKVTWPSRQELSGSAVLVLTASLIIALVVLAMDKIWGLVTDVLYMGI
jgi:preprotein translocase subunit SecE